MNSLVYDIWLSLCCTPASVTFKKLLGRFSSAEEIYFAPDSEIRQAIGSNTSDRTKILDKDLEKAKEIYTFVKSKNVGVISYFDSDYPIALREISTPPVLLYYRGALPDFNSRVGVGIVGSREVSDIGRESAFYLGYDLARSGAVIVSGMARGIDGVAMTGALTAEGTVVAVIGSGIDICYPSEHLYLARETVKRGCIITEYAPGTKPLRFNFPKRNRIIAALSDSLIVVQAGVKSGALITADYAKEYGRRLYAFPGNANDKAFFGTNSLIKNGAKLITSADDVVSDYLDSGCLNPFMLKDRKEVNLELALSEYKISALWQGDDILSPPRNKKSSNVNKNKEEATLSRASFEDTPDGLKGDMLLIYKKIPVKEGCTVDSLTGEGFDARRVASLLLRLEIGGYVEMLPGDRVKRNFK